MPPLGNRGKRLLARIVDGIAVGIVVWAVFGWWIGTGTTSGQVGISVIEAVVYFVYDALMMQRWHGQTLGKRLLGLRVAMLDDGTPPRAPAAWARAAVYSLPTIITCIGDVFALVNILWCTWDQPYHQCLHDKAAKTVVVAAR